MPKQARKSSRGAQGAGNIRQRKDGTWEARYTLGRDPGTGKQVQKSVYGKTQKEVLEKLRKIQTDIDSGMYAEPVKLTVGEWLDIWVTEYQSYVKEGTRIDYQCAIKHRIRPAIGTVKLSKFTAAFTFDVYGHATDQMKQGSANRMDRFIEGLAK